MRDGNAENQSAPTVILSMIRALFWEDPHQVWGKTVHRHGPAIRLVVFALFAIVNAVLLAYHEPWLDEAQAWTLVRDLDFPSLMAQLAVEGHPALWYLILFPFVKLGFPMIVMGIISLAAVVAAAWLLLRCSPLPVGVQILLLVSPLFLYYLPVIARSYSIGLLLIVAACCLYKDRLRHPLAMGLIAALFFQTHVIFAGFALGLLFVMVVDALQSPSGKRLHAWLGAALAVCGLAATFLELYSGSPLQGRGLSTSILSSILSDPSGVWSRVVDDFVTCIATLAGESLPDVLKVSLSLLALVALVLPLVVRPKENWRPFLIALFGIGAQLFISVFVYPTYNQRTLFIWAVFLAFVWLVFQTKGQRVLCKTDEGVQGDVGQAPDGGEAGCGDNVIGHRDAVVRGFLVVTLSAFCLCTCAPTIQAAAKEVTTSYSGSTDMAEYMNNQLEPGTVVVSRYASATGSVVPHAPGITFWNPNAEEDFTYCKWDVPNWDAILDYSDLLAHYQAVYPEATFMYVLTDSEFPLPDDIGAQLLYQQPLAVEKYESYRLYFVPLDPLVVEDAS